VSLIDYFRTARRNSAAVAKERLQIVIAHERAQQDTRGYLPLLQEELLTVIRRYVHIDDEQVKIQVEKEGDYEVLELNVTLPD
jgi:cell division topological specificity factor